MFDFPQRFRVDEHHTNIVDQDLLKQKTSGKVIKYIESQDETTVFNKSALKNVIRVALMLYESKKNPEELLLIDYMLYTFPEIIPDIIEMNIMLVFNDTPFTDSMIEHMFSIIAHLISYSEESYTYLYSCWTPQQIINLMHESPITVESLNLLLIMIEILPSICFHLKNEIIDILLRIEHSLSKDIITLTCRLLRILYANNFIDANFARFMLKSVMDTPVSMNCTKNILNSMIYFDAIDEDNILYFLHHDSSILIKLMNYCNQNNVQEKLISIISDFCFHFEGTYEFYRCLLNFLVISITNGISIKVSKNSILIFLEKVSDMDDDCNLHFLILHVKQNLSSIIMT